MPLAPHRQFRIFVAHASDTNEEFAILKNEIHEWGKVLSSCWWNVSVEVFEWNDTVPPGLHPGGAQGQIEAHCSIEEQDLVILFLGTRAGRCDEATGVPMSQREIRKALKSYEQNRQPNVMAYILANPKTPETPEEHEQTRLRTAFKGELQQAGLTKDYSLDNDSPDHLRKRLSKDLKEQINLMLGATDLRGVQPVPITSRTARLSGVSEYLTDVEVELTGYRVSSTGILPGSSLVLYLNTFLTSSFSSESCELLDVRVRFADTYPLGGSPIVRAMTALGDSAMYCQDLPIVRTSGHAVRVTISGARANYNRLGADAGGVGDRLKGWLWFNHLEPDGSPSRKLAQFSVPGAESTKLNLTLDPHEKSETACPLFLLYSAVPSVGLECRSRFIFLPLNIAVEPGWHLTAKSDEAPRWLDAWPEAANHPRQDELRSSLRETRLVLRFWDLPRFSHVFVPNVLECEGPEPKDRRVSLTLDATNPSWQWAEPAPAFWEYIAVSSSSGKLQRIVEVPVHYSGGTSVGEVGWRVRKSSQASRSRISFPCPILLEVPEEALVNQQTIQILASLGPLTTCFTGSYSAPRPRFVDDPQRIAFRLNQQAIPVSAEQVFRLSSGELPFKVPHSIKS